MALGQVNVSTENRGQGAIAEVERQFLFIGLATKNAGKLLYLGADSDLDVELGVNPSQLKTQVTFARNNAGANWSAAVIPMDAQNTWQHHFDFAMDENAMVEGVVLTEEVTDKADFVAMHTAAIATEAALGRRLFFIAATRAFDPVTDTWTNYLAEVNDLTDGIAAFRVSPVAEVYPGFLGSYAGRLCNRSVSVADSPMRVKTGTMIGIAELPQDSDGVRFNNAHAKALNDVRFTVPQLYADYPGIYCSDGQTLDVPGGDYQVIENLRVVDMAARRVRILAIKRIADRALNSTAIAMEAAKTYFMRPLINMSNSAVVKGHHFPGEITPPEDGDIEIVWKTKTSVDIYMLARPYNNPKKIGAHIALDLSNNAA